MHVALVAQSTGYGGAEEYVAQLLRHLPPAVRRTLVAPRTLPARLTQAAHEVADVVSVPGDGAGRAQPGPLRDALQQLAPDVVHVSCLNPQHDRIALDVAVDVAPVVTTLHLPLPLHDVPDVDLLVATYRRLAGCIAVSRAGRALLVRELRVPARRVTLVRNGVEVPARVRRDARGGRVRLLTVARLDRQKGLDVLLDALERLPPRRRPAGLTILGEGPERGALEARGAALTTQGLDVRLPGECDDVAAALAAADVFCLPSRREGLPLALLEAMAAGLPCVVTAAGDVRPAVGDAALVVEPRDRPALAAALGRLVVDERLRRRLALAARRHAEHRFDVRRTALETADVYVRATRSGPR